MVPGFNYLIYLGQVLELLNKDKDMTFVIDSPSSGHALTMLESTHNFRDIFESGIVFEDTKKMINLLFHKGFMKVNILTLPTLMAVNESYELNESLQKIEDINTSIFCNNSFSNIEGIKDINLPDFLATKIDNEQQVAKAYPDLIESFIPHNSQTSSSELIKELVPSMKNLV
jgi:arsenite-transporting ATPase